MFERFVARWRSYKRAQADALWPEREVHVSFSDAAIEVAAPNQETQTIGWSKVRRILVETNDSGPWGADVWWVLEGGGARCCFPQGATGETAALAEIARRFPTFQVKGMNSTSNATFVCWEAEHAL
jgi:hypothetical protein